MAGGRIVQLTWDLFSRGNGLKPRSEERGTQRVLNPGEEAEDCGRRGHGTGCPALRLDAQLRSGAAKEGRGDLPATRPRRVRAQELRLYLRDRKGNAMAW
jgi:hypothetical protein